MDLCHSKLRNRCQPGQLRMSALASLLPVSLTAHRAPFGTTVTLHLQQVPGGLRAISLVICCACITNVRYSCVVRLPHSQLHAVLYIVLRFSGVFLFVILRPVLSATFVNVDATPTTADTVPQVRDMSAHCCVACVLAPHKTNSVRLKPIVR